MDIQHTRPVYIRLHDKRYKQTRTQTHIQTHTNIHINTHTHTHTHKIRMRYMRIQTGEKSTWGESECARARFSLRGPLCAFAPQHNDPCETDLV